MTLPTTWIRIDFILMPFTKLTCKIEIDLLIPGVDKMFNLLDSLIDYSSGIFIRIQGVKRREGSLDFTNDAQSKLMSRRWQLPLGLPLNHWFSSQNFFITWREFLTSKFELSILFLNAGPAKLLVDHFTLHQKIWCCPSVNYCFFIPLYNFICHL